MRCTQVSMSVGSRSNVLGAVPRVLPHRSAVGNSAVRVAHLLMAVVGGTAAENHRCVVCRSVVADMPQVAAAPVGVPVKAEDHCSTSPPGYEQSIMLQGFAWDSCDKPHWYQFVQSKIPDIVAAGITHVWLPPPSQSVSPQGYMPGQLYNLESKYGSQGELLALTTALNAAGIKPVADIVINHRCADEQLNGIWNKFRDDVDHGHKKVDWGRWAITSDDPKFQGTGNPDTGDDWAGAPDLDHLNPELRAALKEWLGWLQNDLGFKGWRLDYSKGYGAEFVKEYIEATTIGELNVGEYWTDLQWDGGCLNPNQNAARQTLVDWINKTGKTATAFDFPTKGILQEAVKRCEYWRLKDHEGKASGGIGWWSSRMMTFVDNHDTGSTQQHWPFPGEHIALGNAYILTHPGLPCIFWDHLMNGGETKDTIVKLIALRNRNGINSRSKLDILCAEADMYVARIDGKVTIKVGPRCDMGDLVPKQEEGWSLAASGKDFAVWEKAA